jgi:hypothetical protein
MSVLSLRRQHDPLHFEGAIAKDIRAADATASRRALRVQCALTIGYAESADASFRPSADLPKTNGKITRSEEKTLLACALAESVPSAPA